MFIAQVVIIGILLVFLILVILTLILSAFPRLVNRKKTEKIKKIKQAETVHTMSETPNNSDDELALISVITAAIAAYREGCGESSDLSSFKVVAFRKTKSGR